MGGRAGRRLVWVALAGALTAAIVFGLASTRSASLGRLAPALPRESLAGPPVTLAGLLANAHGRAALVSFWASWCEPCAREAPVLEAFAESAAGSGRLVAVDWNDPVTSDARSFVKRYRWTFPVLRDAEGTVGSEYRITGLPTTFVIDASGRIRAVLRGPQSAASLGRALASTSAS
jgi:cytochrome c biogenesis protein CcmG, thiol:disulfide interchange protein DsbE